MKSKIAKMIPHDKLLHLYGGAMLQVFFDEFLIWWIGFVLVTLIGIGIELIYDKWMGKGTPEALDAVYTSAGSLIVILIKGIVLLGAYLLTFI